MEFIENDPNNCENENKKQENEEVWMLVSQKRKVLLSIVESRCL
jgi:hypothetical protein